MKQLLAQNPVDTKIYAGNREAWLNDVADFIYTKVKEEFVTNVPRENIKLSVGFMPNGAGSSAIGVCHYEGSSAGNYREIFIKPTLGASTLVECIETAQVVAHEVVHAMLPAKTGHGPQFARIIKNYLGAEGKPTATIAGPAFTLMIQKFILELGFLPHAKMTDPSPKTGGTTASVKCTDTDCIGGTDKSYAQGFGMIFRVSIKVAKTVSNFRCPACAGHTIVELPEHVRDDYK